MPKMTKTQAKRLLKAIDSKSKRLWSALDPTSIIFPTADMIAIEKIVKRNLKRLG